MPQRIRLGADPREVAAESRVHLEEEKRKRALLQRVKVVRDAIMLNRNLVKGSDDTKVYFWVNVHPARQAFFQGMQYRVCREAGLQCSVPQNQDGTYMRGDLILYETEKEWHSSLMEYNDIKAVMALEAHQTTFEDTAEDEGVPTFRPVA